jgi:hypothetical protein
MFEMVIGEEPAVPTLENNTLVFRFPHIEAEACLNIDFVRTLRIPETDPSTPAPPILDAFALRHVEDHATRVPPSIAQRGGVIMPVWQAEAVSIGFESIGPARDIEFPVALMLAAGKINAVTGEAWQPDLRGRPQNYVVVPRQSRLDGFVVESGEIRQFVAMPSGTGLTIEEQLTGAAQWAGIQIMAIPMKRDAWMQHRSRQPAKASHISGSLSMMSLKSIPPMGLCAGGRVRQKVYRSALPKSAWDISAAERVFVHLVNASHWAAITDEPPPSRPPTAKAYRDAGLPWFDEYSDDHAVVSGSPILRRVAPLTSLLRPRKADPLSGA